MSNIQASLTVLCPFDHVPQAMAHFVAALPLVDGKSTVALRTDVAGLTIERLADLSLMPCHSRSGTGSAIMNISWRAHDEGLYPVFYGTLSVEETGHNVSRLDLSGTYAPPLGLAGAAFDAVAGHHIALEAARELLDQIRAGVERAFQTGAPATTV